MKWLSLFLVLVLLAVPVDAAILSINYPSANDTIPETARIKLDVTSNALDSGCQFEYDNVRNQSINCHGVSLVNLPNVDGTYIIRVYNGSGDYLEQPVNVSKPTGNLAIFIYALSLFVLFGLSFSFLLYVLKLTVIRVALADLMLSLALYFLLLFDYYLVLDNVGIPFLLTWLDIAIKVGVFTAVFIPLILWVVCAFARTWKKGKKGKLGEELVSWYG